ncbi:MAG TPA: RNA polymerase sigma-54 factor, partial [Stellaceae bacterium]|nr:RNA polymerase sigma-54 factor [Stellaceae bacterium]
MALSQRLDLRQSQSLVMTPQLQQAIKLLQLSQTELNAFVEAELERNPLLEHDEGTAEPGAPEPEPAESAAEADERELWTEEAGSEGEGNLDLAGDPAAWQSLKPKASAADGLPGLDQTLTRATTLRDHLLDQIQLDLREPAERIIALHLLDLVDDAGYVRGDLSEVGERLGAEKSALETVLRKLQRLDPPGVFARNLAECLALQLRERDRLDPAMQALLENLPLLASRNLPELTRICGVDAEDIQAMAAELKALDPRPGLAFDPAIADPVIPDVIVRSDGEGGFLIELNSEALPRVLVNNAYYAQVSKGA